MADPQTGPPEDINKISFWMVRNRLFQSLVSCFAVRSLHSSQYFLNLCVCLSGPLYGSLLRAWQCFFSSTERLSALHTSISQSLVSEDLEKARVAYHKSCQREQNAQEKENQAKNKADLSESKLSKIQQAREKATQERGKARDHYEKVLEDVTGFAPRYMEEMESVFDQSQEEDRKRISFLKQAFLSIHRHLDITNNGSIKAVYSELHHMLMSINEPDDLRWWKNNHGPGMPTDWPKLEEWNPPIKKQKPGKKPKTHRGTEEKALMIGGVRVRAVYNYTGEEPDELSFKAGEEFLKVEEEDDQGWCWGVKEGGVEGFYPANYVLPVK
uniref:Zgc:91999 n=1 Tax=Cyprinus carpio TaxID=7962 RepID=A0A8C2KPQ9_CYPCA